MQNETVTTSKDKKTLNEILEKWRKDNFLARLNFDLIGVLLQLISFVFLVIACVKLFSYVFGTPNLLQYDKDINLTKISLIVYSVVSICAKFFIEFKSAYFYKNLSTYSRVYNFDLKTLIKDALKDCTNTLDKKEKSILIKNVNLAICALNCYEHPVVNVKNNRIFISRMICSIICTTMLLIFVLPMIELLFTSIATSAVTNVSNGNGFEDFIKYVFDLLSNWWALIVGLISYILLIPLKYNLVKPAKWIEINLPEYSNIFRSNR